MAKWTVYIMLAVCGVLIVWDIIVATNKERGDTIFEILLAASIQRPWSGIVLGIVIGILIGHLWWPQIIKPDNIQGRPINVGTIKE